MEILGFTGKIAALNSVFIFFCITPRQFQMFKLFPFFPWWSTIKRKYSLYHLDWKEFVKLGCNIQTLGLNRSSFRHRLFATNLSLLLSYILVHFSASNPEIRSTRKGWRGVKRETMLWSTAFWNITATWNHYIFCELFKTFSQKKKKVFWCGNVAAVELHRKGRKGIPRPSAVLCSHSVTPMMFCD